MALHPANARPEDLITGPQAEAEYGVPQPVVRQWATRGRINRYPGRWRQHGTMYSRREIAPLAATYRPTPQRAPRAA